MDIGGETCGQGKPIPNFPGYRITTNGDVWSCRGSTPLRSGGSRPVTRPWHKIKLQRLKSGYLVCGLRKDGKTITSFIHRLVLRTFIGPCPEALETRHLNGNPTDNRLKNLVYGTSKENAADAKMHLGSYQAKGENASNTKLTEEEARIIRWAYKSYDIKQWQLAKMFGVSRSCIKSIVLWRSWKHLTNSL